MRKKTHNNNTNSRFTYALRNEVKEEHVKNVRETTTGLSVASYSVYSRNVNKEEYVAEHDKLRRGLVPVSAKQNQIDAIVKRFHEKENT